VVVASGAIPREAGRQINLIIAASAAVSKIGDHPSKGKPSAASTKQAGKISVATGKENGLNGQRAGKINVATVKENGLIGQRQDRKAALTV